MDFRIYETPATTRINKVFKEKLPRGMDISNVSRIFLSLSSKVYFVQSNAHLCDFNSRNTQTDKNESRVER